MLATSPEQRILRTPVPAHLDVQRHCRSCLSFLETGWLSTVGVKAGAVPVESHVRCVIFGTSFSCTSTSASFTVSVSVTTATVPSHFLAVERKETDRGPIKANRDHKGPAMFTRPKRAGILDLTFSRVHGTGPVACTSLHLGRAILCYARLGLFLKSCLVCNTVES
jgi:hypothetical protein